MELAVYLLAGLSCTNRFFSELHTAVFMLRVHKINDPYSFIRKSLTNKPPPLPIGCTYRLFVTRRCIFNCRVSHVLWNALRINRGLFKFQTSVNGYTAVTGRQIRNYVYKFYIVFLVHEQIEFISVNVSSTSVVLTRNIL